MVFLGEFPPEDSLVSVEDESFPPEASPKGLAWFHICL